MKYMIKEALAQIAIGPDFKSFQHFIDQIFRRPETRQHGVELVRALFEAGGRSTHPTRIPDLVPLIRRAREAKKKHKNVTLKQMWHKAKSQTNPVRRHKLMRKAQAAESRGPDEALSRVRTTKGQYLLDFDYPAGIRPVTSLDSYMLTDVPDDTITIMKFIRKYNPKFNFSIPTSRNYRGGSGPAFSARPKPKK